MLIRVYKDLIISTIVDEEKAIPKMPSVYKDLIISTIVDSRMEGSVDVPVYKDLIISTIVDLLPLHRNQEKSIRT